MANRFDVIRGATGIRIGLTLVISLTSLLGSCTTPDVTPNSPLSFSGRILDQDTMQPIEGAYVIAGYYAALRDHLVDTTRCVKTLGMYTKADGEYRFPIERLDNLSPSTISAIKHGYRRGPIKQVDGELWKSNRPEKYVGRDVYLMSQSRTQPVFLYAYGGDDFCATATTTANAAASARFLEIEREELIAYGASREQRENLDGMIRMLRTIDERNVEYDERKRK